MNDSKTLTGSFAFLKTDGTVESWGKYEKHLQFVQDIFSTEDAFAALKTDGSVVTWGHSKFGGDSSKVKQYIQSGVLKFLAIFWRFFSMFFCFEQMQMLFILHFFDVFC